MKQRGIHKIHAEYVLTFPSKGKKSFDGRKIAISMIENRIIKVVFVKIKKYIKIISVMQKMKFEYDKEVDAAYLYLQDPKKTGEAKKTVQAGENINLDFDENNKLLGIEILSASKVLKKEVVEQRKVIA